MKGRNPATGEDTILPARRLFTFKCSGKLRDKVQEMINIIRNPVLIPRMPFGKHKDMPFREVPPDYLQWLLTTDLDEDMAYTVKYHLGLLSVE